MGKFELMALAYAIEAQEAVVRKKRVECHHGEHLAA